MSEECCITIMGDSVNSGSYCVSIILKKYLTYPTSLGTFKSWMHHVKKYLYKEMERENEQQFSGRHIL